MNRVMIQEGYSLPFDGARKRSKKRGGKKRRTAKARRAAKAFGRRVKACGVKWRKKSDNHRKTHSWRAFLKKCM